MYLLSCKIWVKQEFEDPKNTRLVCCIDPETKCTFFPIIMGFHFISFKKYGHDLPEWSMLHSITALLAWKHLCTLFIGPTWRRLVQFQFRFVFFHRVKFWLQCFYDVHYCLRTTVLSSANKKVLTTPKKKPHTKKYEWSTQWLLMNKRAFI